MTSILELSRERIVTTLLRFCALFGFIASLAGTPSLISGRFWGSLILGWGLWLIFLGLSIYRSIPHRVRASLFFSGAYLFLITALQEQESTNQLFLVGLFISVVLVFLLLGNRWGGLSIIISLAMLYQRFRVPMFVEEVVEYDAFFWLGAIYTPWLFYIAITIPPILIVLLDLQAAWQLERKAAVALQQESIKSNESMMREQSLREELERTLGREIELNSQKSKIIESIFHEFRTPLAIINQSSELLATFSERLSDAKKDRHREAIQSQIFYLDHLMQDILVANTTVVEQSVDNQILISMRELAERLMDKWASNEAGIEVRVEAAKTAVFLQLDSRLYFQAMDHLIGNGIKFSEPPASVTVTLTVEDTCFKTAVQDEGIGVMPEEQRVIFELFRRGSNVDHRRGMGLGLFIANKLATAMQGELCLESSSDSLGSTFTLNVPVKVKSSSEPK